MRRNTWSLIQTSFFCTLFAIFCSMSRFPVKPLSKINEKVHAYRDYLFSKIQLPSDLYVSFLKIAITGIDNSTSDCKVSVNDYKPGFLLFDYHRHVLSISLVISD